MSTFFGNYYHWIEQNEYLNKSINRWFPEDHDQSHNTEVDVSNGLYVVGKNGYDDLGFGHSNPILKLTKHKLHNIKSISCGDHYNIFMDQYNNCIVSGHNSSGQCGFNHDENIIHLQQISFPYSIIGSNQKIKKICTAIGGSSTFFITNNNELYCNGLNFLGQLGLNQWPSVDTPTKISNIYPPIDVVSAEKYSLMLCSVNANVVISHWIRIYKIHNTPIDIINMTQCFYGTSKRVYSTSGSLHRKWKLIKTLEGVDIIKIATGNLHSLFLESNGTVWITGNNLNGQLGIGNQLNNDSINIPIKMTYFIENNIKIKDICCGSWHNLAIDYNDRVYSWGHNKHGECGNGTLLDLYQPELIPILKEFKIEIIKCGSVHSYCKTMDGKHFLFGSNKHNEVLKENEDKVDLPFLINEIIYDQCNGKYIQDIYLCDRGTFVILNDGINNDEEEENQSDDDWMICHVE